ncbi:MAG TPA: RNA methyltransferase [bacterium]|nr:RNA methyltransferase [bacterium]HNS33616.1 RNA methyltransferase [bacterium]HNZ73240.1 RNA methyltransferase [bacterium]HOH67070.1 RNA methyltransferase [bacterium]HQA63630.1 RNA methyltransferase [bacterium]
MSKDFYVICDNIRSLYNVGSIFRTADALGVKKIYLCGITGTPLQKGLAKVALGAEKSVSWEKVGQTWRVVEKLKRQGVQVVALEQTLGSIDVKRFKPIFPLALVLGNEVDGVAESVLKRTNGVVHIPMAGIKESLNVAVAFGIAGYEIISGKVYKVQSL